MQIILGNKNYSSWSLRGWLALRKAALDFDEKMLSLNLSDFNQQIYQLGGAGRVPMVIDGDLAVWDSLAIIEYASEKGRSLWPSNQKRRAIARSVCAEMHSGFMALRSACPMNCRAEGRTVTIDSATQSDIDRIESLWSQLITEYRGPFLMGDFSAADIMFAPIVSRFKTYGIRLNEDCTAYCERILMDEDVQRWYRDALQETEIVEEDEAGV